MSICLVTGGAGFIGSHVVEALVRDGHRVRVLDDLSSGCEGNLAAVAPQIELYVGRITDTIAVKPAMNGVDKVFHLAAVSSVPLSMAQPEQTLRVNAIGTTTVMREAADAGVTRFVNISSAAIYGNSPRLPKSENMQPAPFSPYALSKRFTEEAGHMFGRAYGLPVVSLRYFNVYGPRQRPDSAYAAVVPKFVAAMSNGCRPVIFGTGLQVRDFVFVEDVVRATLTAAEAPRATGKVINIAGGAVYNLLDLVSAINAELGTSLKPIFQPEREGDIMRSSASVAAAERWLGFRAQYSLEEGIAETVRYSQPEFALASGF